jgi:hypothetical protein
MRMVLKAPPKSLRPGGGNCFEWPKRFVRSLGRARARK